MDNTEIVRLLRKDMMGEHQAIIQYLFHAYGMAEGEIPCAVEEISRDEMRHFDWLADAITELGGDPTLDREPVDFSFAAPPAQLLKDVNLEQVAIDQYREHIEAIDDPGIRRLLSRILHDELAHKQQFADLAAEAEAEGVPAIIPPAEGIAPQVPERVMAIINQGIRHEYTVILQYLYHSFVAEGKELAETLQNSAINEMQHMGWLSEALTAKGGVPDMQHDEVFASRDPEKNLEADIAVEEVVTGDYTTQLSELAQDDLKSIVARIRDHEVYHTAEFQDLLAEVREEQENAEAGQVPEKPQRPSIPSVGSLLGEA